MSVRRFCSWNFSSCCFKSVSNLSAHMRLWDWVMFTCSKAWSWEEDQRNYKWYDRDSRRQVHTVAQFVQISIMVQRDQTFFLLLLLESLGYVHFTKCWICFISLTHFCVITLKDHRLSSKNQTKWVPLFLRVALDYRGIYASRLIPVNEYWVNVISCGRIGRNMTNQWLILDFMTDFRMNAKQSHLVADVKDKCLMILWQWKSANISSRTQNGINELKIEYSFVAGRIVKNRSHTFSAFLYLFLEIRKQKEKNVDCAFGALTRIISNCWLEQKPRSSSKSSDCFDKPMADSWMWNMTWTSSVQFYHLEK